MAPRRRCAIDEKVRSGALAAVGRESGARAPVGDGGEGRGQAPPATSPAGREAAEVVRALVKAGRSVILYDATNEAVRDFLVEVRQRMEAFLAAHGELALQVHPYELLYAGEAVYVERDRERSLALRLYRDGVRRLTFAAGLSWEELSRFITVLGVMFKGIRHQEEDFVTLLWKADLPHVKLEAVAGFRPEDEEEGVRRRGPAGEGLAPANETQAIIFDAPYTFDHPVPPFQERGQVAWRRLSAEVQHRFAAEESDEETPRQCLALVREVVAGLRDPLDRLEVADVLPLVREIRDFLLAANRLDVLLEMAWLLRARLEGEARRELLLACLDERAVGRALAEGEDEAAARKVAACLLPEHLDTVLRLAAGQGGATPPPTVLTAVLEHLGRGQEEMLRRHAATAPGPLAAVLLSALARLAPEEAAAAAEEVLGSGSEEAQGQAVGVLKSLPYGPRVGRALVRALGAASEEVRLAALQVLAKSRERRALPAVVERLSGTAAAALSAKEASALGITLALLDPQKALELFAGWLKPGGLLQRVVSRPPAQQVAAVSGLSRLPGPAAEELLAWAAQHACPEARERAQASLQRRREATREGSHG